MRPAGSVRGLPFSLSSSLSSLTLTHYRRFKPLSFFSMSTYTSRHYPLNLPCFLLSYSISLRFLYPTFSSYLIFPHRLNSFYSHHIFPHSLFLIYPLFFSFLPLPILIGFPHYPIPSSLSYLFLCYQQALLYLLYLFLSLATLARPFSQVNPFLAFQFWPMQT